MQALGWGLGGRQSYGDAAGSICLSLAGSWMGPRRETTLRLCRRKYLSEPCRLLDEASEETILRRCRRKYLSEPCRLWIASPEGTECRNRFSPMAAPWESTATREGKQPEGLQQNEYCNFVRFCIHSCKITIASSKTMSPFLISKSFATFIFVCKNSQFLDTRYTTFMEKNTTIIESS